jgi:hypothetical protein
MVPTLMPAQPSNLRHKLGRTCTLRDECSAAGRADSSLAAGRSGRGKCLAIAQIVAKNLCCDCARPATPLLTCFLAPRQMYHFVLTSCLILFTVHILRSRGWW